MATKKISELEAITEADGSDVLAIVDVSEGKTNKITKNNLLKGSGHTIEMSLNENYQIVLKLKNAEGTELSTATIDLPNENAITNISYSNGTLTLTKQSGVTSTVDISGLINGLATETALTNLANALKETIGIDTNTYNESQTYNTGDIVIQNEKIYKANQDNITGTFDSSKWDEISLYEYQKIQDEAIEENYKVITKLQEDVEDLTERVEDAENNEITNTPTPATSHYLQDSAGSRFRKFIPIGRTTQESTTGKQLFNINGTYTTINSGTALADGDDLTVSGTNTSSGTVGVSSETINIEQNTDYNVTGNIKSGLSSARIAMQFKENESDSWGGYRTIKTGIGAIEATVSSGNYKFARFLFYCWTSAPSTATPAVFDEIMLSTTGGDYEPYTGGEPAPNPIYPIAIKNTGDNGSVNEKVQNKNLFDENTVTFTVGVLDDNGNPTGSTASHYTNNFYQVTPNTNYTLKGTLNSGSSSGRIYYYDKDKKWISRSAGFAGTSYTFITPNNCYYIRIQVGLAVTLKTGDVQLEQGSTATTYEAHSEQNPSFPLSSGQKLMQGDYPADDEKVHHVSGEMLFDGSSDENWIYNPTYAYFYITTSGFKSADFCDNYSKETSETLTNNHFRFNPNNGNLYIKDERFTSASSFKTNLATNNIILQGELAEEQTEDFTEEQKTAWEEWKKARTYKNITHISSEDETPANVEIEYVVDINTIDDRITALEAKVDLLEE